MSVNEANLTNRLIAANKELTALKTAQQKGVDQLRIYSQSVPLVKNKLYQKWRFVITVSDEYPPNPMIEFATSWVPLDVDGGGDNAVLSDPSNEDTPRVFYRIIASNIEPSEQPNFSVFVRCSSKIQNISVTEIPW